jgi:hypothetical protein
MASANLDAAILFAPARRRGLGLHVSALLLVFVIAVILFSVALSLPAGAPAIALIVIGLFVSLLLPFLFYRLYSLIKSGYWVSRDGVRLRWGLRQVDLPYQAIVDVARWAELEALPAMPRWIWPGSVSGATQDKELGKVEFLAADQQHLVLIGTKERVYVISPENDKGFVATLKRESLRGSLRPLRPRSISPSFVLVEAWGHPRPRQLILGGAGLAIGLLLLVGFLVPGLAGVSLGFAADGQSLPLVSASQLFLLPALNLFFYMGNLMLGVLFYREPQGATVSSLLWASSPVVSLLFLGAVLFSL